MQRGDSDVDRAYNEVDEFEARMQGQHMGQSSTSNLLFQGTGNTAGT